MGVGVFVGQGVLEGVELGVLEGSTVFSPASSVTLVSVGVGEAVVVGVDVGMVVKVGDAVGPGVCVGCGVGRLR